MKCPYCNAPTSVTNSRSRSKGTQVWRRRSCSSCSSIWTTHEVIDLSTSHRIEDSQGHLKPFSRDKLYVSIKDSLNHRKTALEDATALTDTVMAQILTKKTSKLATKDLSVITNIVISAYDPIAGTVYKASR